MIYAMLKHHRGRYMAQFAKYMVDGCEVMARAYVKRRTTDANAARPRCSNPALRQGSSSCVVYGRGFWCKLSDAPRHGIGSSASTGWCSGWWTLPACGFRTYTAKGGD